MLTREGRKPTTKTVGLENVGVELDKAGAIKVSILTCGVIQANVMCAVTPS
jgi:pyruvate/2-oxoglutarate dehydrogenase complex dihydrolipoamide dehydrogenase (E3) component